MPNAAQFRSLARQLEGLAQRVEHGLDHAIETWGPKIMSGGNVATKVKGALTQSESDLHRAASQIRQKAEHLQELSRHADTYAQQMAQWTVDIQRFNETKRAYDLAFAASSTQAGASTFVLPPYPGDAPPARPTPRHHAIDLIAG